MDLHADLSRRARLDTRALTWQPAPMAGVAQRLRNRRGGEEILVLEGTFADAQGSCPAGSRRRNPPGSVQRPWSEAGCTIGGKTGHLPATQAPDGAAH